MNKLNGVWTIDAFSYVRVPLYRTFSCSSLVLLLKSKSDSHISLFQTLSYRNFGQKRWFCTISTRATDWQMDGQTDTPSYGDVRTHLKTHIPEKWSSFELTGTYLWSAPPQCFLEVAWLICKFIQTDRTLYHSHIMTSNTPSSTGDHSRILWVLRFLLLQKSWTIMVLVDVVVGGFPGLTEHHPC